MARCVCVVPSCKRPRYRDPATGVVHDFCGRTHAKEYACQKAAVEQLEDIDPNGRKAALQTLSKYPDAVLQHGSAIAQQLENSNEHVRQAALRPRRTCCSPSARILLQALVPLCRLPSLSKPSPCAQTPAPSSSPSPGLPPPADWGLVRALCDSLAPEDPGSAELSGLVDKHAAQERQLIMEAASTIVLVLSTRFGMPLVADHRPTPSSLTRRLPSPTSSRRT